MRGYSSTQSWPSPNLQKNCTRSYLVGENWAVNKDFGLLRDDEGCCSMLCRGRS
jgi:hypothetical protein